MGRFVGGVKTVARALSPCSSPKNPLITTDQKTKEEDNKTKKELTESQKKKRHRGLKITQMVPLVDPIRSYNGEWRNNLRHGTGKMVYQNGRIYYGKWKDGKRHDEGKLYVPVVKRGNWPLPPAVLSKDKDP